MHLLTRLSLVVFIFLLLDFRVEAFVAVGKLCLPVRSEGLGSLVDTARPCRHAVRSGLRSLRADIAVTLKTPLGIVFEEVEPGKPEGLIVAELVPGGNADLDGRILVGDKLISTSAVVLDSSRKPLIGLGGTANTNWKREMIPVGKMGFSGIMNAIQSNSGRWGYKDCRIVVRRTDKSVPRGSGTIRRNQEEEEEDDGKMPIRMEKDSWED